MSDTDDRPPRADIIDWEPTALSVARNMVGARLPMDELLPQLNLTLHDFELLCDDPLFQRKVKEYITELKANGTSFVLKARVQAEELLKTQFKIARDKDTPPSVAVAAISNTVRWAGYDKRAGESMGDDGDRPKISINITLAPPAPAADPATATFENELPQITVSPTH